jgi:hypothetical protein
MNDLVRIEKRFRAMPVLDMLALWLVLPANLQDQDGGAGRTREWPTIIGYAMLISGFWTFF